MSVRDYARNYLPDGSRRPAAATGRGAVGSDASSGSTPGLGTHALDGPEHTPATGTDQLLATTDRSGLMSPLSGNPADAWRGDGTWGAVDGTASDGEFVEHGAMGSTEDFDPADGNVHTGTLDDDCTATIIAPAGAGPIQMEWWITADGDGHELTVEADGGTVLGDTPPASVDGETYRLVLDRIPGSTNDWVVNLVGGSSTVALADTVEAETTFGLTPDAGVADTASRSDHTHGSPSAPTGGGMGGLLLASDHATPIVFDDILQASDGHDFLYASEA